MKCEVSLANKHFHVLLRTHACTYRTSSLMDPKLVMAIADSNIISPFRSLLRRTKGFTSSRVRWPGKARL